MLRWQLQSKQGSGKPEFPTIPVPWHSRMHRPPSGNDSDPFRNVLSVTSMVDWNPRGNRNAQSGIKRCHPMDYRPSAQYQNDKSDHSCSATTNGDLPRLPIATIRDPTTLSPNSPHLWTSTRTTEYPRQPSGTTPPIQPQ